MVLERIYCYSEFFTASIKMPKNLTVSFHRRAKKLIEVPTFRPSHSHYSYLISYHHQFIAF